MFSTRRIKALGGCIAAIALVMAMASPAGAAEANDIIVEVGQVDGGLEIGFYCAATSAAATNVRINSCTMEYRTYSWAPVRATVNQSFGNVALAAGRVTGLQGGEDHYRENTWVCWDVTATTLTGTAENSSGCKQVA
jgi:hypothetical protein